MWLVVAPVVVVVAVFPYLIHRRNRDLYKRRQEVPRDPGQQISAPPDTQRAQGKDGADLESASPTEEVRVPIAAPVQEPVQEPTLESNESAERL